MLAAPSFHSFKPPKRTLMGPGPSDVPQRVLDAMARPTIGHLDPAFVGMMEEIKTLLRYAFQTQNERSVNLSFTCFSTEPSVRVTYSVRQFGRG